MQLLGFTNGTDFDAWKNASENNAKLALMLQSAKLGDVVGVNINGDTYHIMIVRNGSTKGRAVFYYMEGRQLVDSKMTQYFAFRSTTDLRGATILRAEKSLSYNSVLEAVPGASFGNVDIFAYRLPSGWDTEADGIGGIAIHRTPDTAKLGVELIAWAGLVAKTVETGPTVSIGLGAVGLIYVGITMDYDGIPIYIPEHIPYLLK